MGWFGVNCCCCTCDLSNPTSFDNCCVTGEGIDLAWAHPGDLACMHFELEAGTNVGGPWTPIDDAIKATVARHPDCDCNIIPGHYYTLPLSPFYTHFRVRAVCDATAATSAWVQAAL